MRRLLPVVEGEGEEVAVPGLLYRALRHVGQDEWVVAQREMWTVGGLPDFRAHLDNYAESLRRQRVDAILILLDIDDGCPMDEGLALAADLRQYGLPVPVAVVLASREYEAWFLASLETIASEVDDLPDDLTYPDDPEERRGCKEWLGDAMPGDKRYRPTTHQAEYTRLIDFDLAAQRSRSFQRLLHAVEELTTAAAPRVTPERP